MLSDAIHEFHFSMRKGKSLNNALTELREEVVRYSADFYCYPKFITKALVDAITQLQRTGIKDKPEMLLRLLTMLELVFRYCAGGQSTIEELEIGLNLAFNGTRYKLKAFTANRLKRMGAAQLDETNALEFPTYPLAKDPKTSKNKTPKALSVDARSPTAPIRARTSNVFTLSGRPYTPDC